MAILLEIVPLFLIVRLVLQSCHDKYNVFTKDSNVH